MTPKHDIIGIEQNGAISDAIDIIISSGKAESKKKAEQLASKNALIHYGVLN